MDIKKEPEESTQPMLQSDESSFFDHIKCETNTQWRTCKIEMVETTLPIKNEEDFANCFHYEEQPCFGKVFVDFGNVKHEIDVKTPTHKEKFAEITQSIKCEEIELLKYSHSEDMSFLQITSEMESKPIILGRPYTPENHVQNFNLQVDEIDFKNELEEHEMQHNHEAVVLNGKSNGTSNKSFIEKVPIIKLQKVKCYKRNFVCNFCNIFFASSDNQRRHTLNHIKSTINVDRKTNSTRKIKNTSFECEKCNNSCTQDCEYKHHKMSHINKRSEYMKNHKINHSRKRHFKCNECNYSSTRQYHLNVHKMIHSGEKPFKCDLCDYACSLRSKLKVHVLTHTGEKPFTCDECDHVCSQRSNLKIHKMTHSGEKPFKCENCDYTCSRNRELKRHRMTHSGEKPFKCEECDYMCIRSSQLKRHRMNHSGIKSYKCDECDYAGTQLSNLKVHKITHSGKYPFKCDECSYVCLRRGQLNVHKLTHSDGG